MWPHHLLFLLLKLAAYGKLWLQVEGISLYKYDFQGTRVNSGASSIVCVVVSV